MATEIEICNLALIEIGDDTITSLTDESKRARQCNLAYPIIRDMTLRDGHWNFAIKRASLAQNSIDPLFTFSNSFALS